MASIEMEHYLDFFRSRKNNGGAPDPQQARAKMDYRMGRAPLPEGTQVRFFDLNGIPARELLVPGVRHEQVLLFIHGGGFFSGTAASAYFFGTQLATHTHQRVVSIEYRLGPESGFQDGLSDCVTAYRTLLDQGIPSENIVLSGDSAGGYMCISLTLWLRNHGIPLPGALVLLSPFTGFGLEPPTPRQLERESMLSYDGNEHIIKLYFANEDLTKPASNAILDDFHDFPPTYIQVCTDEILFGASAALAKKLGEAGRECCLRIAPGLCHGYEITMTPEAALVAEEAAAFLSRLHKPLPKVAGLKLKDLQEMFDKTK